MLLWQITRLLNTIQPQIIHAQAGKASELLNKTRPFLVPVKTVTTIHGTKKNKAAYLVGDAIITVSQALTHGLPPEKVKVIYNGVYAEPALTLQQKEKLKESIENQFSSLNKARKTIICIGRLEPVKNIALLIQTMQGIDANLWIVGDGSLRNTLEAQVNQLKLGDQIVFLGFRRDARQLIQLADVVVLSSDREGFPLVMVEALQADRVMASTQVNGVVEWLPAAYLAHVGDAQGLKAAIRNALNPSSKRDFLPLFKRAKTELTVAAMAEQTEKLYERLLRT